MTSSLITLVCLFILLLANRVSSAVELLERAPSPRGLDFNLQICTSLGNCQTEPAQLVLDWSYVCDDPKTCNTIPDQSVYENRWGIFSTGDSVTFNMQKGPNRLYVTSANGYRMFYLLNHELTYDIDLSTVGCGLNAALDLTAMSADGGAAEFGYAGAQYGTGFCDGQDYPPNCLEMDIWEANSLAAMFTIHPCNGTNCNAYGCGLNTYPLGYKTFYGRGPEYDVDTTKPFTVVTRFPTVDGTDTGDLKEIQQFFVQNGKKIEIPTVEGGFNSISDGFCEYHYVPTLEGYDYEFFGVTKGMSQGMRKGMVLIMSLWGSFTDPESMYWLDQEPYGPCPVYANSNASTTYSNIRFGPIGSTV